MKKLSEKTINYNKTMLGHAMERAGLRDNYEPTLKNNTSLAQALVGVVAENIILTNNIPAFKFPEFITKEGTIFGEVIMITCKKLPNVEVEEPCKKETICNESCDESEKYQTRIPVQVLKVVDRISTLCLLTSVTDEIQLNEIISQIRNDVRSAIQKYWTKKVILDFSNNDNFTDDQIIYVEPDANENVTDDQITEAIREAQYLLNEDNNLNTNKIETYTDTQNIYALLNNKSRAKYDKLYACCINASAVFGDWRDRVRSWKFDDDKLIGYVYDAQTYIIRPGRVWEKVQDCGKDECIRVWQQYGSGFNGCKSRVKIVIGKKPADDPQKDVDDYVSALTSGSPFTSAKLYADISVLTGEQTATALGITLPANTKDVVTTLTFKSKDDGAKTITYTAKVNKTTATEKTADIVIKASDAELLLLNESKKELLEKKLQIKKLTEEINKLKK